VTSAKAVFTHNGHARKRQRWQRNRRNIWCNNDWEFYKVSDRQHITDSWNSENTKQENTKSHT
jgi:hypothetical protein